MTLQRLIITFKPEELEIRTLYRRRNHDGPGPNSKARRREVEELSREGLRQALASLEGGAEIVGTSGFTQREDTLSLPRLDEPAAARRPRPRSSISSASRRRERGPGGGG